MDVINKYTCPKCGTKHKVTAKGITYTNCPTCEHVLTPTEVIRGVDHAEQMANALKAMIDDLALRAKIRAGFNEDGDESLDISDGVLVQAQEVLEAYETRGS